MVDTQGVITQTMHRVGKKCEQRPNKQGCQSTAQAANSKSKRGRMVADPEMFSRSKRCLERNPARLSAQLNAIQHERDCEKKSRFPLKVIIFGKMRFRRREKITKKNQYKYCRQKNGNSTKDLMRLSGKANPIDHETESNTTTKKRVECRKLDIANARDLGEVK